MCREGGEHDCFPLKQDRQPGHVAEVLPVRAVGHDMPVHPRRGDLRRHNRN